MGLTLNTINSAGPSRSVAMWAQIRRPHWGHARARVRVATATWLATAAATAAAAAGDAIVAAATLRPAVVDVAT